MHPFGVVGCPNHKAPKNRSKRPYHPYPPIDTSPLPAEICPVPLCGASASPILAAGFPLTNTVPLPVAMTPWEFPQQLSLSVVVLPTTAAGIPLIRTSFEHPPLISPENASGECGGTWPVCSPAVVPVTASPNLAALGISNHPLTLFSLWPYRCPWYNLPERG